ncbi:glutaredoxin 3 [Hyphomonas sp. FCG-A18]|jgi:glutaredoxin 3|uniref:glutaredoxin 3 n=1 Tax=Hyphomonas sp. FCG-A18 TaxID=3080019 RepID=UPI002B29768E|nr:glutaredoxin 3 [Hyphomonas sp. FCG-A18]
MPHILLYTMGHCPYCKRAKALLREKGVSDWEEYDLEVTPRKRAEMKAKSGGRNTVPQIFIGGIHVGGADDLFKLDAAGGLDPLLKQ